MLLTVTIDDVVESVRTDYESPLRNRCCEDSTAPARRSTSLPFRGSGGDQQTALRSGGRRSRPARAAWEQQIDGCRNKRCILRDHNRQRKLGDSWSFLGSGKHLADDAVTAVVRLVPMLFFRGLGRLFLVRRGPVGMSMMMVVYVMCVAISGRHRCNFDDPTGVTTVQTVNSLARHGHHHIGDHQQPRDDDSWDGRLEA